MSWRPREERAETPLRLPAERIQARRFGKTRSAQSSALLEDYVELIADLLATTGEARATDIARRLGVSHVTAIKTISRLKRGSRNGAPLSRRVSDEIRTGTRRTRASTSPAGRECPPCAGCPH
jgi:hypothetical protein